MALSVRASRTMHSRGAAFLEDRSIRIPEIYREALGLQLGSFIKVQQRDGSNLILQVSKAYNEDVAAECYSAYVTEDIYKLIHNEPQIKIIPDVMLGCDPEFFLVNPQNGYIVHAGKYFQKWERMGHDGTIAELRPDPNPDATVVVSNIRNLLKQGRARINKANDRHVRMISSSSYNGITAGFHIHFGMPPEMLGTDHVVYRINSQIIQLLDYYVGLPCIIQEGIHDTARRCTTLVPYGKAGDFRLDWRTLEYRVPGGAMLRHPKLAAGLISTAAVVVESAIIKVKELTGDFKNMTAADKGELIRLYQNVPGLMGLYGLICVPNIDGAMAHLDIILDDIRKMEGYERRAASIEGFFQYLPQVVSNDLEHNWDLEAKEVTFH